MTTFVLVHGAWGGAHGFRLVRPILQAEGHEVFTPSLTGIGERVHLTGPQITLRTHIDDVVNQVLFEDLNDIVLLGFSYGGMVVTGALEHVAERVRHLVYLDAFVPSDGQSVADLVDMPRGRRAPDDPWSIPPTPRELDDPDVTAWWTARRVAQPLATFTEAVRLTRPLEEYPFGRTYIKARPDHTGDDPFGPFGERFRNHPAWTYREIATGHMIPENRPAELGAMLLEIADRDQLS
jgi:pimeloyl-ACP methyl ester carboxylesterase